MQYNQKKLKSGRRWTILRVKYMCVLFVRTVCIHSNMMDVNNCQLKAQQFKENTFSVNKQTQKKTNNTTLSKPNRWVRFLEKSMDAASDELSTVPFEIARRSGAFKRTRLKTRANWIAHFYMYKLAERCVKSRSASVLSFCFQMDAPTFLSVQFQQVRQLKKDRRNRIL